MTLYCTVETQKIFVWHCREDFLYSHTKTQNTNTVFSNTAAGGNLYVNVSLIYSTSLVYNNITKLFVKFFKTI